MDREQVLHREQVLPTFTQNVLQHGVSSRGGGSHSCHRVLKPATELRILHPSAVTQ